MPGVLLSALVTQVVDSITALEDISSTAAQRLSALLRMTEEKGAPLLVDANGEPHAPAKVRASQSSFLNFFLRSPTVCLVLIECVAACGCVSVCASSRDFHSRHGTGTPLRPKYAYPRSLVLVVVLVVSQCHFTSSTSYSTSCKPMSLYLCLIPAFTSCYYQSDVPWVCVRFWSCCINN